MEIPRKQPPHQAGTGISEALDSLEAAGYPINGVQLGTPPLESKPGPGLASSTLAHPGAHNRQHPNAAQAPQPQTDHERTKRREQLIAQVVQSSGVAVGTHFTPHTSPNGYSNGWDVARDPQIRADVADRLEQQMGLPPLDPEYLAKLNDHDVYEVASFVPLTEPVYDRRQVTYETRGIFGQRKQHTEMQTVQTGTRNVGISDILTDADNSTEPAVVFRYTTHVDNHNSRNGVGYLSGHEPEVRRGTVLSVAAILPASLARRLEAEGRDDPNLMRELASRVMQDRLLRHHSLNWSRQSAAEAWSHGPAQDNVYGVSIRPPYEAWRDAHEGRSAMYFTDGHELPPDASGEVHLNPANIRPIPNEPARY